MVSPQETLLTILPGSHDDQRLVLVLCQNGATSSMELRQQSWGVGVGWFTQSSVALEPHQVAELRSALGSSGGRQRPSLPQSFSQLRPAGFAPRVVRADSA